MSHMHVERQPCTPCITCVIPITPARIAGKLPSVRLPTTRSIVVLQYEGIRAMGGNFNVYDVRKPVSRTDVGSLMDSRC